MFDIVRDVIERLPRNARVVIGSRSLPELGLGRLRARGELLEIDADLLRFSADEVRAFLSGQGTELSARDLDDVVQRTEGWPAALWLLSLALKRPGASLGVVSRLLLSDRGVADYLSEEVLAQQRPEVRHFLLRTSVLRQINLSVCQALLPRDDCATILDQLARDNVFLSPVQTGPGPAQYRYHSLFADFLKAQLQREHPDLEARLHLAASGWYEDQQRPVPAIDHAIEGGDHAHAVHLLREHALALLEAGRLRLLDRWFNALPPALLSHHPFLQVIAVWACCLTRGPWGAMTLLEESGCVASPEPAVQAHVRALRPVLLAMMDRYDEAREAGEAGLQALPTGQAFADSVLFNAMAHISSVEGERRQAQHLLADARRLQGDSEFNRMYTETLEGVMDMREGRFHQALARFRMAAASSTRPGAYQHDSGNAWAGVFLAEAVYETHDLPAAERLLKVYLPIARQVGLPDHLVISHRLRARIQFSQGEVDAAFQTLTEQEALGHARRLPRVVAAARLERARLFVLQGHTSAAADELRRADDPAVWTTLGRQARPAHEVEDLFIAQLRLDLHAGEPAVLAEVISRIDSEWRRAMSAGRRYRVLKLRLLLAMAFHRSGDPGRGADEIGLALREASREGYCRLLLDEGPLLAPVVRRLLTDLNSSPRPADPVLLAYAQRLLDLLGPGAGEDSPATGAANVPHEALTSKEIRVLQLLAEGYSNAAMAEKLFVSDSTVRTHLRNINTKLDSRSRTQAVAVARRLGVIR